LPDDLLLDPFGLLAGHGFDLIPGSSSKPDQAAFSTAEAAGRREGAG
jgi:hypothetical protein